MSEPSSNLDLTALTDALGEEDRQTIAQGIKTSSAEGKQNDSPISLSPSPTPSASPMPPINHHGISAASMPAMPPPTTTTTTTTTAAADTPHPDPNVQNIKAMFPEMDVDTIHAVLVADGGNFEQAINTLLQMSDPTYVPPPPFQKTSQSYEDEQLARSIAAQEEEEGHRQNQSIFPASRGGGLGSLFRGGNGQQFSTPSTPSYDPNQLSYQPYQPRVRRTTSGQQRATSGQSYQESQSSTAAPYGNVNSVWPTSKDAKVWQEDINKMAGVGFAKAASTFSALRQRGEKAFAGQQQHGNVNSTAENSQQQSNSSLINSDWNSRKSSTTSSFASSVISPTIGSSRGFDKDPTPVDDNELAKILARGREEAKKPSISERYKKVSSTNLRTQSKPNVEVQDEDDEELGWDDAGRTGSIKNAAATTTTSSSSVAPSFEPIRISDNSMASSENSTTRSNEEKSKLRLSNTPRNAVSLMESSTGRGLTSPQRSSAKTGEEDGDDDDSNDLEYVSNPFEDED